MLGGFNLSSLCPHLVSLFLLLIKSSHRLITRSLANFQNHFRSLLHTSHSLTFWTGVSIKSVTWCKHEERPFQLTRHQTTRSHYGEALNSELILILNHWDLFLWALGFYGQWPIHLYSLYSTQYILSSSWSLLLLFSCSVVSNSLGPYGLQHTRLACPSPSPGACSNSCPLSQLCHPTISASVDPFSSCL